MNFADYLLARHTVGTVKRYLREVSLFLAYVENGEVCHYGEVMDYLGYLRNRGIGVSTSLCAIKKYYGYLVFLGKRIDNPALSIRLRDKGSKDVQLQDLFSIEELEKLLDRVERYPLLYHRNRLIISLLIYQGLTNGELRSLELSDINLNMGTVYIKGSHRTNSRTLKLRSRQIYWLVKYIESDRAKLLKVESDKLLISKSGIAESGEGIGYLLERCRGLYPGRKLNAQVIRQSVLRNLLLSGKDLRLVQYFAGHKYASSTERYKESNLEALQSRVLKYHPLG